MGRSTFDTLSHEHLLFVLSIPPKLHYWKHTRLLRETLHTYHEVEHLQFHSSKNKFIPVHCAATSIVNARLAVLASLPDGEIVGRHWPHVGACHNTCLQLIVIVTTLGSLRVST